MVHDYQPTSFPSWSNLALIKRDRRRYQSISQPRNHSPHAHHRECLMAMTPRLHGRTNTSDDGPYQRSISTSQSITESVREENIAHPRPEVVYGSDQTLLGCGGFVEGFNPARIDVESGNDTDVVAIVLSAYCFEGESVVSYPQRKDPSAKKRHNPTSRRLPFVGTKAVAMMFKHRYSSFSSGYQELVSWRAQGYISYPSRSPCHRSY